METLTPENREALKESLKRIELSLLRLQQEPTYTLTQIDRELRDIRCEAQFAASRIYSSPPRPRLIGAGIVEVK